MKILNVIHRYPPAIGGSEVWLREIGQQLSRRHGHRVEVSTLAVHDEEEYWAHFAPSRRGGHYGKYDLDGNVEIVRHRQSVPPHRLVRHVLQPLQKLTGTFLEGPHSVELYRALPAAIRNADLVHLHAHPYPHVAIGLWLCKRIGRPAFVTPHFHPASDAHLGKRSIRAMRMADRIFVVTEFERDALIAHGLESERMVVTGNGIDLDRIEAFARESSARDLGLARSPGVGRIIFVGRKTRDKAVDLLVEAVRRARVQQQIELVLVGPDSGWFRQYVNGLDDAVRRWVRDLGVLSDQEKFAAIRSSDMLVQPSAHEAFGIVFLEAWASGLPVIGADAGAVPSVIGDGGRTFRAGDADDLARAITRLLNDPHSARMCASNGLRRIKERFDWARLADAVNAAYRTVRPRPRRVLVVSGMYPPHSSGGAEVMARIGAVGLARRGYEIQVLGTYRDNSRPRWEHTIRNDEGTRVHYFAINHEDNAPGHQRHYQAPEAEQAFRDVIDEWRPEVVHFHNIHPTSHRLIDVAEDAGIATVMTLHDYWAICFKNTRILPDGRECSRNGYSCLGCAAHVVDAPAVSMLERNAAIRGSLDRVRLLLAPSRYLIDRFVENQIPRSQFTHLPNGVDLAPFSRVAAERKARSPLRFGFIGYIGDHKGVFVLAHAAQLLTGAFQLRVFGEGHRQRDLTEALQPLGTKAEMLGPWPHDRISEAFASIDVLVLPSLWPENFPVSIVEALASATVVIASDAGGIPEQITPGENGLLVPAGNVDLLAAAMQRLVDNPALVARLSDGARQSAGRYTVDTYLTGLEERYAQAFHSPPRLTRSRPLLIHSGLHDDTGGRDIYAALGELSRRNVEIEVLAHRHASDSDIERAFAVVLTPDAADATDLAQRAKVYGRPLLRPRGSEPASQLQDDGPGTVPYEGPSELTAALEQLCSSRWSGS